jgi:hypothetical protein
LKLFPFNEGDRHNNEIDDLKQNVLKT